MTTFTPFPKIPRLSREMVITEKIDGTNASILIEPIDAVNPATIPPALALKDSMALSAGSRSRWIAPGKQTDNHGFAGWVMDNLDELFKLGPGHHFGEWWGKGIQHGYGLDYKVFSLFNTTRWNAENLPACVSVVPELYRGPFDTPQIEAELLKLKMLGSVAAPGWMKPEGIIIYHVAANQLFKKTLVGDESPKSLLP
jgi:hypothetical protein